MIWDTANGCDKEEFHHPLSDIVLCGKDQCPKLKSILSLHKLNHCETCSKKRKSGCVLERDIGSTVSAALNTEGELLLRGNYAMQTHC